MLLTSSVNINIDWSDLDLFGHVNNVMFFRYMQASRLKYCEGLGLTSLNEPGKLSFMVASCHCDFKKPLHYPGSVTVKTVAAWVKNTSFCLKHELYDDKGEVCATGEDVLVLYDYVSRKKSEVTPGLRQLMES